MQKAVRIGALVIALACSVRAGDMQNPAVPPPPATTQATAIQEPTGQATEMIATEFAVSLLQEMLSLF